MTYSNINRYNTVLTLLFDNINPDCFGEVYKTAKANNDVAQMIQTVAKYYRERPTSKVKNVWADVPNSQVAKNAVRGIMREVDTDYTFPNNEIDFLYNPTEKIGTLNHEWLWQFNRHSYWVDMAFEYQTTNDEEYARVFNQHILGWVKQTECPKDEWNAPYSAWRTIECGIRLLGSWQTAFEIFRKSTSVTDEAIVLMVGSMYEQTKHLVNHPTKGNWLLMECTGAYTFAALFPEFYEAKDIRKKIAETMASELDKQILPDGLQYELSPDYHSVSVSCYSGLYTVAKQLGYEDELPETFSKTLLNAILASIKMSTPGFTQPCTNDCYTVHTNSLAKRGLAMFEDHDEFKFVDSVRKEGKPPVGDTASFFFPYAGFCVMRNDWSEDSAYLCFDVGPIGMGHEHMDKLNVNIFKGADELIFDDGGGHYDISDTRVYGISGYDHNTILVDDLAQVRTAPRKYESPVDASWITNAKFDYACGVYDDGFGKDELKCATHKREVRFCKPGFFVIEDIIEAIDDKEHNYDLLFHVDTTKTEVVDKYANAIIARLGKTYDTLIVPLETEGETVHTASAQKEPHPFGWYVGRYNTTLHPATTIIRGVKSQRSHKFTSLIFPMKAGIDYPTIKNISNRIYNVSFDGKEYVIDLDNLNQ